MTPRTDVDWIDMSAGADAVYCSYGSVPCPPTEAGSMVGAMLAQASSKTSISASS